MSFSSVTYLVFFALVLVLLSLVDLLAKGRHNALRHGLLLVASYIFYGWWDWRFCFLMALLTLIAWWTARQFPRGASRLPLVVGVVTPLVILGIFKYCGFFLDSFRAVTGMQNLVSLSIILPVGISFYTFQSISYTMDVYRGKVRPASLPEVALYISFFPQLVAGPIVKAQDFLPQLRQERRVTLAGLESGLQIFLLGLFKKIVLADRLSVFVDDVFATPVAFSSLTVALAVVAYALQIYFDFSGYSDMAIGCARCMGYALNRNFNLPYLSKNPSEFWKRWHISLSTWLQEYLYIPLGGNRRGVRRTYINLMLTMLLGGLWHGASWTFVVWGGLHGLALCLHKLYVRLRGDRRGMPAPVALVLNNCFVWLCWVFFRAESFRTAATVLKKLVVWSAGVQHLYTWLFFALALELVYTLFCRKKSKGSPIEAHYIHHNLNTIPGLTLFFFEIMMVLGLAYTGGNPFIYFQF